MIKLFLILTTSILGLQVTQNCSTFFANPQAEVTSTFIVSGKDGENVEGKYVVSKPEGSTRIVTEITQDGNFVIEGTSQKEVDECIKVCSGFNGSLTIKNLKISYNGRASPIYIDPSSNIDLILDGDNSLRASQYYPAIGFYGDDISGLLKISAINNGGLYAVGGGLDAAAIGGAAKFVASPNSGNIQIDSGELTISSLGLGGAAIGSGAEGGFIDNITINGGNITAIAKGGNTAGAAIGSGSDGSINSIVINGGTIDAQAYNPNGDNVKSAAIGSGSYGSVKSIEINNGTISTTTDRGVGIGSGINYRTSDNVEKIEINGGSIKTSTNVDTVVNTIGVTDDSNAVLNSLIINGGSVSTNKFSISPKNKEGQDLSLLKIDEVTYEPPIILDGVDYNIPSIWDNSLSLFVTKANHVVKVNPGENEVTYNVTYNNQTDEFDVTKEGGETSIPWEDLNHVPSIEARDIELYVDDYFSDEVAKKNVKAHDDEEGDITDRLKVIYNDVDTSKIGRAHV